MRPPGCQLFLIAKTLTDLLGGLNRILVIHHKASYLLPKDSFQEFTK